MSIPQPLPDDLKISLSQLWDDIEHSPDDAETYAWKERMKKLIRRCHAAEIIPKGYCRLCSTEFELVSHFAKCPKEV